MSFSIDNPFGKSGEESFSSEMNYSSTPSLKNIERNKEATLHEIEKNSCNIGLQALQLSHHSNANLPSKKPYISSLFCDLDKFFNIDNFKFDFNDFQDILDYDDEWMNRSSRKAEPIFEEEIGQEEHCSPAPELDDIAQTLINLQIHYNKSKADFREYGSMGKVLETAEYGSLNKENLVQMILRFNPEKHDIIKSWLNSADSTYKWTNCIAPLIANIIKYSIICDIQEKLSEHQKFCQTFVTVEKKPFSSNTQKKIQRLQQVIEQFNCRLEGDKKEAVNKGIYKAACFTTKLSAFPLERLTDISEKTASKVSKCTFNIFRNIWGMREIANTHSLQKEWISYLQPRHINIYQEHTTSQEQVIREVKNFLRFLTECTKIEDVQAKIKEVGIKLEIPPTIEEFKALLKRSRFIRELIQSYHYCSGQEKIILSGERVIALLRKKEEERNRKINQCFPSIAESICGCHNKTFKEIKEHFAQLHIDIDSIHIPNSGNLPLPPTTKSEWGECVQSEAFCKALAGKWVDFQETSAQLTLQATRQALLSKHAVEREFLGFRKKEYTVGIASTLAQLVFCGPYKLLALGSALELFVTDISKLGVPGTGLFYICYPLYPGLSFKIEGIFMLLAEHFFAIKYKPNEYSLESYKLSMQVRVVELALMTHSLLFMLNQFTLWLNMRLIENCMMRLEKKPMKEDNRYIQSENQYEQYRLNCKQRIEELKGFLNQLYVKDAKSIIQPQAARLNGKGEEIDPIQDLVKALKSADVDYFPPQVVEFFDNHLGFKLTNENNQERLQEHLEHFFSNREEEFVRSYDAHRFDFLRGNHHNLSASKLEAVY